MRLIEPACHSETKPFKSIHIIHGKALRVSKMRQVWHERAGLCSNRNSTDVKIFRDNSNPDPGRLMLVVIEHNEKAGCSMLYTRLSIF